MAESFRATIGRFPLGLAAFLLASAAGCGQTAGQGAGGSDAESPADVVPDAAITDSATDAVNDSAPVDSALDALTDVVTVELADAEHEVAEEIVDVADEPDEAPDLDVGTDAEIVVDVDADAKSDVVSTGCELNGNPAAGEAGAACVGDGDCNSGSCVQAPEGKRCAPACGLGTGTSATCCPTGWSCDKSGASPICKPKWTALCAPCSLDSDCSAFSPGSLCVKHGETGSYCATKCASAKDCPSDYKCSFSYGVVSQDTVCVLPVGGCECNQTAIDFAAKTACSNSNSAGTCKGFRKCAAGGLQVCDAQVPAAETCNAKDDDCNGKTDDGLVNSDVDGDGIPDCDDPDMDGDGSANAADCAPKDKDVFPGNAEKCNGFDDNCSGTTDEGFPDLDKDGLADCVDADMDGDSVPNLTDCSPTDGDVFQTNVEKCDGIDQNCNGKTDEGFPDLDKDGLVDCVDPDIDGDGANNAADCSPTDAAIYPGAPEKCDGADDNCNGKTDEGFADLDKDGMADCVDPDVDNDGTANAADCAPDNAAVHPGATEVCNGVDDDCDGATDPGCDDDADGYCDANLPADPGSSACPKGGGDCDDVHAAAHPGATEICDGLDNNCDGSTDPGCDTDGDGYCVGSAAQSPSCPNGGGDCNDGDIAIKPGGVEICDNKDQNCDGTTDEGCDADKDGYCAVVVPDDAKFAACPKGGKDCADKNAAIHPGIADGCDGVDNDCDGITDPGCDQDGDGYCAGNGGVSVGCSLGSGDCNDGDASIHPKAAEVCDDLDNDCANGVDDGCDVDGDGWCKLGATIVGTPLICSGGVGDCNDKQKSVYPGAPDLCDGLDNGCNSIIDKDCDKDSDGYCDINRVTVGAPFVCLYGGGDCNDNEWAEHPGNAETCDGIDNDCDGVTDNDCDIDGDGYCALGMNYLAGSGVCSKGGGDCDDLQYTVHPSAAEICDDLDNNCDLSTDEGCDDDLDGFCDKNMTTVGTPKACVHGGGDCNDLNVSVAPNHVEICDNFDNNCDGATDPGCDDDGDDFCDANMTTVGAPTVCPNGGGDCLDTNAAVKPGALEFCDGLDNNCISGTDEGCNDDGDAYCDGALTTVGKPAICPSGGGDCDDLNAQVNPGMTEVCDDVDNNCVNATDEGCDDDKDKFCDGAMVTLGVPKSCPYGGGDCNDTDPLVGAVSSGSCFEKCDGLDNNNDGVTDENCDKDKDGYCDASMTTVGKPASCPSGGGDCNDSLAAINPGIVEKCSTSYDDNCDGLTDSDGATGCTNYWADNDNDGYGGQKFCYCNSPNSKQTYGSATLDPSKTTKLTAIGSNNNGAAFEIDCPAGYVASGVSGQVENSPVFLGQFNLLCRKLNSDGTLGISATVSTTTFGTGSVVAGTCPNSEILVSEWGDQNGSPASISRLGGHCATLSRLANQYTGWDDMLPNSPLLFDGGGTGLVEQVCPVGYAVTGAHGFGGGYIGVLGYKCTPVNVTSGYIVYVTKGGDCNDFDAATSPLAAEICDNLDNNCSGVTDEGCDADGDKYCNITKAVIGTPTVCPKGGGDCADNDAAVHPGATELCNAVDDDCNSVFDPGCDDDGDHYCDINMTTVGTPSTCTGGGGDCNDTNATIHPSATEICDNLDNTCTGKTDTGCDDDSDGYCDAGMTVTGTPAVCPKGKNDCADTNYYVNPGVTEICDNIDNNCSGKVDEGCDDDGDGWCRINATFVGTPTICSKGKTDCNDSSNTVYPGATELCDGLDNGCSGKTDTGCDDDKDGYCDANMTYVNPSSCVHGGNDCNDASASVNPGAADICGNGVDDDCSGPGNMSAASLSGSSGVDRTVNTTVWNAFAFVPSATGTLASVTGLKLRREVGCNCTVSVTMRIYTGGLPGAGGTQVGSSSQNVSSYQYSTFNFAFGGIAVTKNSTYYAVLSGGTVTNAYVQDTSATGNTAYTLNSGTNWTAASGGIPFTAYVTVSGVDGPVCQ